MRHIGLGGFASSNTTFACLHLIGMWPIARFVLKNLASLLNKAGPGNVQGLKEFAIRFALTYETTLPVRSGSSITILDSY